MNLYFRMVRLFLRQLWASKLGSHDTSKMSFRVWPTDLDTNIHLNDGRFVTIMDLGRIDFVARTGLLRLMMKRKWMPVAAAINITYFRSLLPFEKFELRTRVLTWDEAWFYMEQEFWFKNQICASAIVKVAFKENGKRLPPHTVMELLEGKKIEAPAFPSFLAQYLKGEGALIDHLKSLKKKSVVK